MKEFHSWWSLAAWLNLAKRRPTGHAYQQRLFLSDLSIGKLQSPMIAQDIDIGVTLKLSSLFICEAPMA